MQQKTVVLTVIIFTLIVMGMFMYAKLKVSERSLGYNFFNLELM